MDTLAQIELIITKRTDPKLLELMEIHYSQPKGFVGRNICYAIYYGNIYYGHIVGGSATIHLPNRNQYFDINKSELNHIVNNIFYHIEKQNGEYPTRNFTSEVVKRWRQKIINDWYNKYGDDVYGFESLVELPRDGLLYLKDNWEIIGQTRGWTCKRVGGKDRYEKYTGVRVWDYINLRPKLVFCRRI